MEKNLNKMQMKEEEIKADWRSVLFLVFFGLAMVMWGLTINELREQPDLCRSLYYYRESLSLQTWHMIVTLWGCSLWFKLWIVCDIISAICVFPAAVLLSCAMVPVTFFFVLPIDYGMNLVSVSLGTWLFLLICNLIVSLLVIITMPMKDSKEEVSPAR
ncbi:MAG: hypothetical protein VZR95_00230 [Alphaproteobacteria bacterium]